MSMVVDELEFNASMLLDWKLPHPLAGPGYMAVRDMTADDLTTVAHHCRRTAPYPSWVLILTHLRRSLRRYNKLYGATVVADMPVFAIEAAIGQRKRRPVANVR